MTREKKRLKEYMDYQFGFPVILRNVEAIKVQDYWVPDINQNVLQNLVLLALVLKEGHLTGSQVRFVRRWLGDSLTAFGERLGLTHATVKNWEDKGDNPTGTKAPIDFYIRLLVVERMMQEQAPVLGQLLDALLPLSPIFEDAGQVFVIHHNDGTDICGLSPNFRTVIDKKMNASTTLPTSTSLDFQTFLSSSHDKSWRIEG